MATRRDETALRFREAIESMAALRAQLRAAEAAYRRGIRRLEGGDEVIKVLDAIKPSSTRLSLNEQLADLEHARHLARLSIISAGLDEGISISAMGRTMGFSRQLAARFANEARKSAEQ